MKQKNEWNIAEKLREWNKITHISVLMCPIVPNLILNKCLDTACLINNQIHKHQISFFIYIDENIWYKNKKIQEN